MKEIKLRPDLENTLTEHFEGLHSGGGRSSITGGQSAADKALADLNIRGYAKNRSEVLPKQRRGATVLSPYIRHNIISLAKAWSLVSDAPYEDREKFRDELLWQEYARHLYARIGTRLFESLRFQPSDNQLGDGWPEGMACVDFATDELKEEGWLVNQTRMWLASHWSVRNGKSWLLGQEQMYRELIDGSRAANLLGWQWTVGAGTGKPYGFAKWQVEKRAPGLCSGCQLKNNCPIEQFPAEQVLPETFPEQLLASDSNLKSTTGPESVLRSRKPELVLLTVDSMGDGDAALVANQDLSVAFVFNEHALAKLQLSSKRIFFYLETLQDLSRRREVKIYIGDPVEFTNSYDVAVTFAPVPSFGKFENLAEVHPFPWLKKPHAGSVRSFSSWRNNIR